MVNKYKDQCAVCDGPVPANGGKLERDGNHWVVTHLDCSPGESGVNVIRTAGGTFTRNKRGLCEDAPACGCCTI